MTQTTLLDPATFALPARIEDEAGTTTVDFDLAPALSRVSDRYAASLALKNYSRTDQGDFLADDTAEDETPNGAAVRSFYEDKPSHQPNGDPNGTDVSWNQDKLIAYLHAARPSLHPFLDALNAWDAGAGSVDPASLIGTLSDEEPAEVRERVTAYTLTVTLPGEEQSDALRKLLTDAGYAVQTVTARARYTESPAKS